MRIQTALFCSCLLLLSFGCGTKLPARNVTPSELEGVWRVTAIEGGGKPIPSEQVEKLGLTYQFDGDKVTVIRSDKADAPKVSTFKLEATADPKRLTMTIKNGPAVPAIYVIAGDILKLCLAVEETPNAGFPTGFVSQASPKTDLLVLKRQTSATPAPAVATQPIAIVPANPAPADRPANPGSANERRTAWRYVDAPLIFQGQPTTAGVFLKKEGKEWLEERKDAPAQDWTETERTPEYVEISRPNGGFFVRLYNDRCTYRYGNEVDFKPMFPGKWE